MCSPEVLPVLEVADGSTPGSRVSRNGHGAWPSDVELRFQPAPGMHGQPRAAEPDLTQDGSSGKDLHPPVDLDHAAQRARHHEDVRLERGDLDLPSRTDPEAGRG